MQSVKLENASWTDTLKTVTGFRFFARHSEFIFGVVVGITVSGFKFRHQFG